MKNLKEYLNETRVYSFKNLHGEFPKIDNNTKKLAKKLWDKYCAIPGDDDDDIPDNKVKSFVEEGIAIIKKLRTTDKNDIFNWLSKIKNDDNVSSTASNVLSLWDAKGKEYGEFDKNDIDDIRYIFGDVMYLIRTISELKL